MLHNRMIGLLSTALLIVASAFVATTSYGAQSANDSKEVSAFLSDAKTEAIELRDDADELKAFTQSSLNWQSHANKVSEIKEHVNQSGRLLTNLENARAEGSTWQQQAIDQIRPLLEELAANVESTIDHLNQRPKLLQTGPYADYAAANYDFASNLAQLISDYVDYGKAKTKSEALAAKLGVPED